MTRISITKDYAQFDSPDPFIGQTAKDYTVGRRSFMKYSMGSFFVSYSGLSLSVPFAKITAYPISDDVKTTVDRMLSFQMPERVRAPGSGIGLAPTELHRVECLFDTTSALKSPVIYMGTINGASKFGEIIGAGLVRTFDTPPLNSPNPDRRSLTKKEWIAELFNTSSFPKGHGYHLVNPEYAKEEPDFACYSFLPKENIPLRVMVLDNVQDPNDQSHDIHGHGYLSATRVKWLRAELVQAKMRNELVIIASHVPLAVAPIGSEMEWWESTKDPNATLHTAITLSSLISEIQANGNVLCLLAGHRHVNAIKAFKAPPGAPPEYGFWQIETSSLHDFPQQFRTLQVYLNSDYTISMVAVNVDPAVKEGTPAESARRMAIAAQQIIQNDMRPNASNSERAFGTIPVSSMDPTRSQNNTTDDSIRYGELAGVPYCASYNAELFKPLSPAMVHILRQRFFA